MRLALSNRKPGLREGWMPSNSASKSCSLSALFSAFTHLVPANMGTPPPPVYRRPIRRLKLGHGGDGAVLVKTLTVGVLSGLMLKMEVLLCDSQLPNHRGGGVRDALWGFILGLRLSSRDNNLPLACPHREIPTEKLCENALGHSIGTSLRCPQNSRSCSTASYPQASPNREV